MKIDPAKVQLRTGSRYPPPYDEAVRDRELQLLSDAAGLTQFGAHVLRLKPGVWSSQRHWHEKEDEFLYVLEGEVVLVTEDGEETLRAGDSAGFKAGVRNGHHLQNRSAADARVLVVGTRDETDWGDYPDIDLRFLPDGYAHKNGERY